MKTINLYRPKHNKYMSESNETGKKVALITGATRGIGAAFASHYASKGYDLIITGHPDDKIALGIEKLQEEYNVHIETILADFANDNDIAKIEEIIKENQRIEVLINNAGFSFGGPFFEKDISDLLNMIKVHIHAPIRFIYAVLPGMILKKKGTIINLSSMTSLVTVPRDPLYSATKTFHNALLESLHIHLKDKGIKLQVLCPGMVRTNFHKRSVAPGTETKFGKGMLWMNPDKVVEISVRNLHKKNKIIVVTGFVNKVTRFIYILLPRTIRYWLSDRYLR
jgi:uncharacterized protein